MSIWLSQVKIYIMLFVKYICTKIWLPWKLSSFVSAHNWVKLFLKTHQNRLNWIGQMSFLTGQDRTRKFAKRVLPDRTKSGLTFLTFCIPFFFHLKVLKVRCPGRKMSGFQAVHILKIFGLPDRTWCPIDPYPADYFGLVSFNSHPKL